MYIKNLKMRKHRISLISLLLTCTLLLSLLSGCGQTSSTGSDNNDGSNSVVSSSENSDNASSDTSAENTTDVSELFSDRDFETDYDESKSAKITLSGDSASCSSDAVEISGSTITIKDEGTYILSGTLDNGMIIVNADKTDKTQLVLNNVSIHSETSAPVYILQADKVFITIAEGSSNTLSNGGTFTAIDDNNIDAVIFSKEDLTLNGAGTLTITSPAGHGIVSKDSLKLTSGTYDISSASHALTGKDDVCVANANFTLTSGKDGIHAENTDDTALGLVYIQSGTFTIASEGDGISAASYMQIDDGNFNIISGGGSANAENKTSDSWGNFMGGGMGGGGRVPGSGKNSTMGNSAGKASATGSAGTDLNGTATDTGADATTDTDSDDDSTSIKAIKASGNLTINGGTFTIDSADDSIHSNASITVHGGTFDIASGDDGFHADETLTITSASINISESYEGLEGLHINISGGEITLTASDDGLNAAGGTDQSGFGGQRGNETFGGGPGGSSSSSSGSIVISGGTIHVTASGDGLDANGTLEITGGSTTVCGPTQGDTATLDYDTSGVITGGTFIGTGGAGMAQSFSDSDQGVIAVSTGNQSAGTEIKLTDRDGNTIITHTPELDFAVVILSSPDIVSGETYTITVGSSSGEFTAN